MPTHEAWLGRLAARETIGGLAQPAAAQR
jgi:hypothetical protein